MSISYQQQKKGFSLIELLVSISIFAIVITMAVGALLVLIDANAKAQNMQKVMTDLTFVIDSMSREIRTGRGFYCSNSNPSGLTDESQRHCPSGGVYLSLVEGGQSLTGTDESRITYQYDSSGDRILRRIGTGTWYPLTSNEVHITEARFYAFDTEGARDGDTEQANVTLYIAGYAGELESTDSSFQLQTTVTARVLDY